MRFSVSVTHSNSSDCFLLDIVGVVVSCSETTSVPGKKKIGTSYRQQLVELVDETLAQIRLTLWNTFTGMDLNQGEVIAMKTVKVTTYEGRLLLTSVQTSTIQVTEFTTY